MTDIGYRIKQRRKDIGLSAEDIADAIGVSPATIYRYESGDIMNVRIDKLTPIANALHTTEAFLMGWTDDPDRMAATSSSGELSRQEQVLLHYYRILNAAGRAELLNHALTLTESPRYTEFDAADGVG